MPKLTFTIGGKDHTVDVGDSCSIGRTPQNDIALETEQGASRRHCQIMKLARTYELTDLGSTNGTLVNGKKVQRHRLEHGDRIKIGETLLVWAERDDDDVQIEEEIGLDDAAPKAGAGRPQAGDQCYLVYAGGANDGKRLQLDKPRVTIGRKPSNAVVIESAAVSGYHCEITREGGSYVLRDLGSTNGTIMDGDLVTEVALQHGARIRVGDQRLVFVDPSISDFERAMASVDDLGSEWGMLRAEMDMSRVQRAKRSQAVAIVAVVAVVGVAGFVLISNPDLLSEKAETIAKIDGNMVDDFSFESLGAGWEVAEGSPALGGFEHGEAPQGESFYSVAREGAAGRLAVVEFTGRDFTVSPARSYEFGASVKAAGGARALVRVLWVGAGEGRVGARISATDLVAAGGWTSVSAVATPPPNTTGARLQLANAGPGTAYFDDVFLKPAQSAGSGPAADVAPLAIRSSADGSISLLRGGEALLDDVRVVGGVFGEGAAAQNAYPDRAGLATTDVLSTDEGVRLKGEAYDPFTDGETAFDLTCTLREGRYVDVKGSLPPGAALVGVIPSTVMEKGIGVWTETGSFRESGTRYVAAAQRLSIGGLKRFEVRATAGAFPIGLLFDGGAHALALGGEDGQVALVFDTDTAALEIKRDRLRSAAEDAETAGRVGDAIRRYEDYASEFAEGDSRQEDARKRAGVLRERSKDRLARLRTLADGAIAYGETAGLVRASEDAVQLRDGYDLREAEQVRLKVEEALAARRKAVAEETAKPLLARAGDYREGQMKRLARSVYEDVRTRFPNTEAAATAAQALQEMGN